ncbi:sulfurtransferase complex subunit TusC [Nitrincola tibetensis]|uniref:Sulfurtransferase complex subunit TusC n=1 Tax=Nitrincola tibetensis TaxID=2219697 RepID=A0A364NQT2_9GAMM|nr:sulfurtransferase complex subunit TusC [Nitrincola tibetensis]RAU19370.1 sulfurtransferase complex subunit TusC [Nitrincola tibetensis]
MNSPKNILLMSRRAPYGSSAARDLLDIALTCSVFEQNVALLLLDDGVLQLLANQDPQVIQQKNLNSLQSSLSLYDIEKIYIDADALEHHGLSHSELHIPVTLLTKIEISQLIANSDIVLTV